MICLGIYFATFFIFFLLTFCHVLNSPVSQFVGLHGFALFKYAAEFIQNEHESYFGSNNVCKYYKNTSRIENDWNWVSRRFFLGRAIRSISRRIASQYP